MFTSSLVPIFGWNPVVAISLDWLVKNRSPSLWLSSPNSPIDGFIMLHNRPKQYLVYPIPHSNHLKKKLQHLVMTSATVDQLNMSISSWNIAVAIAVSVVYKDWSKSRSRHLPSSKLTWWTSPWQFWGFRAWDKHSSVLLTSHQINVNPIPLISNLRCVEPLNKQLQRYI